jgi:hypothetical protein
MRSRSGPRVTGSNGALVSAVRRHSELAALSRKVAWALRAGDLFASALFALAFKWPLKLVINRR